MAGKQSRTVLFLCTGNYYRSRYAEILFNSVAGRMGLPWRAVSRALALERGAGNLGPMAKSAVEALVAMGIPKSSDFTRVPLAVTQDDLVKASKIVALKDDEHRPLFAERFPDWTDKVEFWKVDDVAGVLPVIEKDVMALIARLLGGRTDAPAAEEAKAVAKPIEKKPVITLKVGRETKGRRGKGVTTISDMPFGEDKIAELATLLKSKLGTGGAVKEGVIEIQGDNRDRICTELEKLGYKVKKAGG